VFSVGIQGIPVFVSGLLAQYLFGVLPFQMGWDWLNFFKPWPQTWALGVIPTDSWKGMILPALVVAVVDAAFIARMLRSSLLEVLRADYIRTAFAKGLSALSPAEYVAIEDQYQNIMRNYGLPESYYAKDTMGTQAGFQTLLANDVSATELEERVLTAQDRVLKAAPQVSQALKAFYPDITNGDILAYTLDPTKGLDAIKRKVTAAEIGGAAIGQGLTTGVTRAEELAAAGVTKQQAQEGYQTIAEVAPRGAMLSDIYKQSPYGQTQAEQEVFNLAGSAEASRQRKKLTSLETAAFSGQAGVGALARERAGNL
jgi:hypothetical protein